MGKYLSTLSAWALSFGSAVGWGAFVMPGTTFLPVAGPLGALFGLGLGAMAMFVIGRNYHYLIGRFPDAGGAYGYAKRVCGGDHGYICGWFLVLTYIAIVWSNATALAIISRHLFGGFFSFGFTYEISGYVVHAGEILLSAAALLVVGGVFLCGKRAAARVQTVLVIALCLGVAACVCGVFAAHRGGIASFAPARPRSFRSSPSPRSPPGRSSGLSPFRIPRRSSPSTAGAWSISSSSPSSFRPQPISR